MSWDRATRKDYRPDGVRCESDLTAKEWAIIEPMREVQKVWVSIVLTSDKRRFVTAYDFPEREPDS